MDKQEIPVLPKSDSCFVLSRSRSPGSLRLVLEVELWRPDASLYENAALPLSDDDSLGSDEENEGVGAGIE